MKEPSDLHRRRLLQFGAGLPLLALLPACTDIVPGQRPAPDFYRLTPKSTFSEGLPYAEWQLVLEPPVANAGLATTRIALSQAPLEVKYYARSSWTDRAPQMVQTLMIESFENSERIVSIGRESLGLRSDFVLKSELREFQAEYYDLEAGTGPRIRVNLSAKLVQMPRRVIVASESFERIELAAADNIQAVVEAFDTALGGVLRDLVAWTILTGEERYTPPEQPEAPES
ncbi:MAG: ABC-type transport auxiliary lipoprotein family protein [Rhodovibrionaceae bacterium]